MAETKIQIALNGVDNTSKVIDGVKAKLDGLNQSVADSGTVAQKATSVASAGMQAFGGTLGGAISGARGMAQAISGMGVAMSTALPIAAAAAAALYSLKKAYDALQQSREAQAGVIRAETDAIVKQQDAVRGLVGKFDALTRQRNRMANIQAEIAGYDDTQKMSLHGELLSAEMKDKRNAAYNARLFRDALKKTLGEDQARLDAGGLPEIVRKALEEKIEKSKKELEKTTQHIVTLGDDIQYLEKQIELHAKRQKEMAEKIKAEKEQHEADKRYEEAKKVSGAFLNLVEAEDEAIMKLSEMAKRRDEDIRRSALQSLSRTISQTMGGAKQTSLEEVNRISALVSSGTIRSSAMGYTTSQGDSIRQAEAQRKTEQYQQKMLELVAEVARSRRVSTSELSVNVMDF